MAAKAKGRQRNPVSLFYRVSVLAGNRWLVKHAGQTKEQAESLVAKYFSDGVLARMSACI